MHRSIDTSPIRRSISREIDGARRYAVERPGLRYTHAVSTPEAYGSVIEGETDPEKLDAALDAVLFAASKDEVLSNLERPESPDP